MKQMNLYVQSKNTVSFDEIIDINSETYHSYVSRMYEGEKFNKEEENKILSFCLLNWSNFLKAAT